MICRCYAATRPQAGRSINEDAFLIRRGEPLFAALADRAGATDRAAKKVLRLFEKLVLETTPAEVMDLQTWVKWAKRLDSSLLGGPQSTFLAVAVSERDAIGICVGDSRGYLLNREGQYRIVTDGARKFRLGSGQVEPFGLHLKMEAGDILILMSNGAWTRFRLTY